MSGQTIDNVAALVCTTTPTMQPDLGYSPTAQWQYAVTIRSTNSTADAEAAATALYLALLKEKGVCDSNYDSLGLQAMSFLRAKEFNRTGSLTTYNALSSKGRGLLQSIPTWCGVIAGDTGAPLPFPCPNYPFKDGVTCEGPLSQGISCTQDATLSGPINPTALLTYSATGGSIKKGSSVFITPTSASASTMAAAAAEPSEPTNTTSDIKYKRGAGGVWRATAPDGSIPADPATGRVAAAAVQALGEPALTGAGVITERPYTGPASVIPTPVVSGAKGIGVASNPGPYGAPSYYDTQVGGNDLYRGFAGLDAQFEGLFPLDAAVAASSALVLNAVAGKAALYALDGNGNATGVPVKVTSLEGLFSSVVSHTAPPGGYTANYAWPSAIHDKLTGRFVLACGSSVQAFSGGKWGYPSSGTPVGGVYIAVSPTSSPQTGAWTVWGMPLPQCASGQYSLPDTVQVTYDRYGIFLSLSTLCVGAASSVPGKSLVYAFDKDALADNRLLVNVPYWDVTNGLGTVGASITSVMPSRPQGAAEADREIVFFAAQNTATPVGLTPADAVLGVTVFCITKTSYLPGAAADTNKPQMCMANINKLDQFKYYKDSTDTTATDYTPFRQPPRVFDPEGVDGPVLNSGLWTYVYANALHGTQSETLMWIATRAVGGTGCEWAGPTAPSTCVPAIWYGAISVIEGNLFFNPGTTSQEVVFNSLISLAYPTIVVNSNGSVAIQCAYASDYDGPNGIIAENLEEVVMYAGVMSYAIDITNGPASFMWARKQGMAALQGPEGLTITPPLPFGRFSGSDVVTLGDGKRRMYTAISHAFNTPNWTLANLGLPYFPERGFNNFGNYITITSESFR